MAIGILRLESELKNVVNGMVSVYQLTARTMPLHSDSDWNRAMAMGILGNIIQNQQNS